MMKGTQTQAARQARPWLAAAAALISALALTHPPAQAQAPEAGASPWVAGPKSRARLLAGGQEPDGALLAGVEIALSGKALTYWRNPGDAGVAPALNAQASRNLATLETIFPVPERHDEGGAEAFGWRTGVIFPLRLTAADPRKPILLDLELDYAACEDICVPGQARLKLEIVPGAASPQRASIEAWRARAPRPAPPGALALAPAPLAGRKGLAAWRVTPADPMTPDADLFAEAPEGYWVETRRAGEGFDLLLTQRPREAAGPLEVRLTFANGDKPFEARVRLDAPSSAP
jgi:DsbC/DsbD-like thiol-disulfide interchange protein